MESIKTKIHKKSEFEYQIKNGAKIIERITKVSGGWYCCCKIFKDIESAVAYSIGLKNDFTVALGGKKFYEMPKI